MNAVAAVDTAIAPSHADEVSLSASSRCVMLMRQAEVYRKQGRYVEAAAAFDRAVALARESEKQNPNQYAEVLSRVGAFYMETGRSAQARDILTDAIARFERLTPMPLAEAAFAWNALGMAELNMRSARQAEESLRQAIALSTQARGEDHPETAAYQTNLALALIAEGQSERAELLLRRARLTIEKNLGESSIALGVVYAELSASAAARNKLATAEEYGTKAVSIYSQQAAPDAKAVALAQINLADVYLKGHRLDDANRILPDAIAQERANGVDKRLLADGVRRLAELRGLQRSWHEAADLYREAISLYEHALGPSDPALRPVLLAYAEVLKHNSGSKPQVKALEARARTIVSTQPRT